MSEPETSGRQQAAAERAEERRLLREEVAQAEGWDDADREWYAQQIAALDDELDEDS